MSRVGILPLVVLVCFMFCQTASQSGSVMIEVIVNNQVVPLNVPEEFLGFITELAVQIVAITPDTTIDIKVCDSKPTVHNCNDTSEICINSLDFVSGFSCLCREGWIRLTTNGECVVDLCPSSNITCNRTLGLQCNNVPGNLSCVCAPGFHLNSTSGDCEITTPCFPNNCPSTSICSSLNETEFVCTCKTGYENAGSGEKENINCTDVDECETQCQSNFATCTNTLGSYDCECNEGFSGDGETCTDIDECLSNPCPENANCMNEVGSHVCTCKDGFAEFINACQDIDECAEETDNCTENAVCSNTIPGFDCSCDAGYTGDGVNCADIDECTDDTDICSENANCTNVDGGFNCICEAGYSGNGIACADNDECTEETDNCAENATCTNTIPGFDCSCDAGYTGDGVNCADIDECTEETDNCAENAACINTIPGFDCSCNTGYTGDGVKCADVDECKMGTHNCSANAECGNIEGGFTCSCKSGYFGNGFTCTDIDECTEETDNCTENADCTNTIPGFECSCKAGYSGDGVNCADIDECTEETDNCTETADCTNTIPGFDCSCKAGYSGDGVNCAVDDECLLEMDNCDDDSRATCTNTDSGFTCSCNDGFSGNGSVCVVDDECLLGMDNCDDDSRATCTNTDSGFTCSCNDGFVGNGFVCIAESRGIVVRLKTTLARRKRDISDDGVQLAQAIEDLIERTIGSGTNVTVTVLNETTDSDGSTIYEYLVAADDNVTDFIRSFFQTIQGRIINGVKIQEIFYLTTATFNGFVNSALNETQICNDLIAFVRNNLTTEGTVSDTTTYDCTATKTGDRVDFNLTVDGGFVDRVDLPQILQFFTPAVTENAECPSTSCHSAADCSIVNSMVTCSCNASYYDSDITNPGKNCISPILEPTCNADGIVIRLFAAYFPRILLDPETIHLLDRSCTGTIVGEFLQFNNSFDECSWNQTHDGNNIIYSNEVTNIADDVQTFNPSIKFAVSCSYSNTIESELDDDVPGINVLSATVLIQTADGTGELAVTVSVFSDSAFLNPVPDDYTAEVGEPLYVKATHSASSSDILKLQECWVTPTSNRNDVNRVDVITNACPDPDRNIATIISNGESTTATFRMSAVKFGSSEQMYTHCNVEVCKEACPGTCPANGRRRRSADDSNVVSLPPLTVVDGDPAAIAAQSNTGTIVAAVVATIFFVACAVLVIQQYRKRSNASRSSRFAWLYSH